MRVLRALFLAALGGGGVAAAMGCGDSVATPKNQTADASDYAGDGLGNPKPRPNKPTFDDSGILGGGRPRDADSPLPDGGRPETDDDSGVDPNGDDSGQPNDDCSGPLGEGDLAIVEIMQQTQGGSGDQGEWVEVQNRRSCTLNIIGLHIESPHSGGDPETFDVDYDWLLAPNETFVIADSYTAETNHNLPGTIVSWIASDTLDDSGDTITLSAGSVTVDSLTYTSSQVTLGRSISFPADCAWSDRTDWTRWSWSFRTFMDDPDGGQSLLATPNGPNDDITCF